MADIQVRIKLNAGVDGDQINSVAFNQETNNVSKAVGSKTTKNDGQNLISWGEDGLISLADGYVGGANATLSSQGGYNGFVFGLVPESKMYSVEITLEGSNIDSVTFYGDKNANQFPTRAIVNGEYIYSDDVEWTIIFPTSANSQTITFDMWNRANYNACITHIGVFTNDLILDKRSIKSVESLSQSTGQTRDIYYGITPSSGSIEILDINGEIKDYIQDGILKSDNLPISIYANEKQVSENITIDSDYILENKSLNLQLSNSLNYWDDIQYQGYQFSNKETTLLTILRDCLSLVTKNESEQNLMLNELIYVSGGLEMYIYDYLDSIIIQYPYLMPDTLRNCIDKICQVAQLNVYQKNNGEIKFVSARPISNIEPIKINASNMFSLNQESIIIKNKYDGIEIYESDFVEKEATSIYNSERIICTENKTLIANNVGVNSEIYDVYATNEKEAEGYLIQFNFSINLKELNVFTPIDLNTLQIKVIQNNENLFYQNGTFTGNINADTTNDVLLKYTDTPLAYHKFNILYIDGKLERNIFNASLNDGVLTIRGQVEWQNWIGSAVDKSKQYNVYFTKYFTFSILKNTYELIKNKVSIGNNRVGLQSNELIQKSTKITGKKIVNYIYNSILSDYSKGIVTGNVTVDCANYYYKDGTLAKDWSKGDMLEVGDIISFGNEINKLSSANFRKTGCPYIDIEYIRCRNYRAMTLTSLDRDVIVEFANSSGVQEFPIYEFYEFDEETGKITFLNEIPATSLKVGRTYYMNRGMDDVCIFYRIKSEVSGTRMQCEADVSFYEA